MDREEITFIESFLTRASINKQWQYARAFVESYGDRIQEINRTYLINHVMRISADEPIYLEKHASAAAMAARTIALGVGNKWVGCEMLYAGKMNFAIIRHDLWHRETRKKTSVVEKIFHDKNKGGFARETKLLAAMPSEALRTPRFFGAHVEEPFYFEYAEFVEGKTPSLDVFERKFLHRALRHLWKSEPTEALLKAFKPNLDKTLGWSDVLEAAATARLTLPDEGKTLSGAELMALLDAGYQTYHSTPNTVFHDDLHRGNIMVKDDSFYILDWDKWKYEKPGAGAVFKGPMEPSAVFDFLSRAYHRSLPVSETVFRRNYLFYNLCFALRKNKTDAAGFFAQLLARVDYSVLPLT